jgi:hypothetical protein
VRGAYRRLRVGQRTARLDNPHTSLLTMLLPEPASTNDQASMSTSL